MFDNVGGKIKGLAKVIGIGGLIVFLLTGLIIITADGNLVIPMLICFATAAICLVSSWPLYGFGKLVEDIGDLKELKAQEINKGKTEHKKSIEDVLPYL